MENQTIWLKTLKTLFILIFILASVYLVRISIIYFQENNILNNHKQINLKFLQNTDKKSGNQEFEMQIEIEDLQKSTIDTLSIENLIPDENKRLKIIDENKIEEPIQLIVCPLYTNPVLPGQFQQE